MWRARCGSTKKGLKLGQDVAEESAGRDMAGTGVQRQVKSAGFNSSMTGRTAMHDPLRIGGGGEIPAGRQVGSAGKIEPIIIGNQADWKQWQMMHEWKSIRRLTS
jgi:hypothetical protein